MGGVALAPGVMEALLRRLEALHPLRPLRHGDAAAFSHSSQTARARGRASPSVA